jgi:hypothetical protein
MSNLGGFAVQVNKENPNAEGPKISTWFILYFNKLLFKLFLFFKNIKMMFLKKNFVYNFNILCKK